MPALRRRVPRAARLLAAAAVLPLLLTACGYGSKAVEGSADPAPVGGPKVGGLGTVRLGYFANVTHATALVGLRDGGPIPRALHGTRVATQVFNAGPAAIEALNANAVDMAWVGPAPAVNGYVRSGGRDLRIVAGATSGGAALVVDPHRVRSLHDLEGKRIATPQLGNTQDVSLLNYLRDHGHHVDPATGRGDVSVLRQDTREIPTTFRQGGIDGAWVPEPTASVLVAEGARKLLDERRLWPGGRFVTTNLVVRQDFLRDHPEVVEAVLRGSVRANAEIRAHPRQAEERVNAALARDAGKPLPRAVLHAAFRAMDVTDDPLAATLARQARHGVRAGLQDADELKDLDGVYDLAPLNRVLAGEGRPAVGDAGLGTGDRRPPAPTTHPSPRR